MEDIVSKYPDLNSLNNHKKIVFLLNSIDASICKKLDYFIYEAFSLRNESIDIGVVNLPILLLYFVLFFLFLSFLFFFFSMCNTICNSECQ